MPSSVPPSRRNQSFEPDSQGWFGAFGGRFLPETLMAPVLALTRAWEDAQGDESFAKKLEAMLADYGGRPSPLYFAERLTAHLGGADIYFKRDELNHTGSHKINNCLGQILLAERMGKHHIIAETGAGQHGVAAATVAARFGFRCTVYMGAKDMARQKPNIWRMKLLGAKVCPVEQGGATLKEAMNEALRHWVREAETAYYLIGTAAGPHPYPVMVREFQSVIGREAKTQILQQAGRLPDALCACIGGGSNAIGLFHPFLQDEEVALHGVEAAGRGLASGAHAAALVAGRPGILHGNRTFLLQDDEGQIREAHSISAGLDYPGVGPEHAQLKQSGRVSYSARKDDEALAAFRLCAQLEGILPALEPAHALAHVLELAKELGKGKIIIMNLCGRGDKDAATIAEMEEAQA